MIPSTFSPPPTSNHFYARQLTTCIHSPSLSRANRHAVLQWKHEPNHIAHAAAHDCCAHHQSTLAHHHCLSQTAADIRNARVRGKHAPVTLRHSLQHSSGGRKESASQQKRTCRLSQLETNDMSEKKEICFWLPGDGELMFAEDLIRWNSTAILQSGKLSHMVSCTVVRLK
jgi:hypothetical protein